MNEFIPRSDAQLVLWLSNYAERLSSMGKSLGLSDAEIKTQQQHCDAIVESIRSSSQRYKDWRGAVKAIRMSKQGSLPAIRGCIARIKVSPEWTPATGQAMGVIGRPSAPLTPAVLDEAKPVLHARLSAGLVQLRFTRRPFEGLNIYTRKKGEGSWRFLNRATASPFIDTNPLATDSHAEVREYQAFGVRKDKEVGRASDVVVISLPS